MRECNGCIFLAVIKKEPQPGLLSFGQPDQRQMSSDRVCTQTQQTIFHMEPYVTRSVGRKRAAQEALLAEKQAKKRSYDRRLLVPLVMHTVLSFLANGNVPAAFSRTCKAFSTTSKQWFANARSLLFPYRHKDDHAELMDRFPQASHVTLFARERRCCAKVAKGVKSAKHACRRRNVFPSTVSEVNVKSPLFYKKTWPHITSIVLDGLAHMHLYLVPMGTYLPNLASLELRASHITIDHRILVMGGQIFPNLRRFVDACNRPMDLYVEKQVDLIQITPSSAVDVIITGGHVTELSIDSHGKDNSWLLDWTGPFPDTLSISAELLRSTSTISDFLDFSFESGGQLGQVVVKTCYDRVPTTLVQSLPRNGDRYFAKNLVLEIPPCPLTDKISTIIHGDIAQPLPSVHLRMKGSDRLYPFAVTHLTDGVKLDLVC